MALFAGCQSNSQYDLVARELRMQEDQIYAMEDYLAQYQQLLCKYRAENAALRRQLADDEKNSVELPSPRAAEPTDQRTSPPAPRFQQPQTPLRASPLPGAPEIEMPDIPPLESSPQSSIGSKVTLASYSAAENAHEPSTSENTATTAAVRATPQSASSTALPHDDPGPREPTTAPKHVSLHGEVVANESGGPRLVVDVEPLDASGNCVAFEGELSLMLLDRPENGPRKSLARWDFNPEDQHAALRAAEQPHAMRFYLELPPETPDAEATEIWVRLMPHEGDKLLTHAAVRLREPGVFASPEASPPPRAVIDAPPPVTIPPIDDSAQTEAPIVASSTVTSDWTIAWPGQPVAASDNDSGKWRAAAEKVALMPQTPNAPSSDGSASLYPVVQVGLIGDARTDLPAQSTAHPKWSPVRTISNENRSASEPQRTVRNPLRSAWSATR